MPAKNKYEIRSQEVQEVLSTPPRILTRWGNALIMIILAMGLIFLSQYRVAKSIKVPVEITKTNGKIVLIVDSTFSDQIMLKQRLNLQIKNSHVFSDGTIVDKFYASINGVNKLNLVLSENYSKEFSDAIALNAVVNGEADIKVSNTTLLQLFLSKAQ